MTTYSTRLLSFFTLFLILQTIRGQENFTAYFQPQIAVNYKVAGLYSHNFSVLSRNYIFDDEALLFKGRQLDITHYSNLKLRDNQSIALGIKYRFRNNFEDRENELRFTQQYNITHKPYIVRFGHRVRAQQRITNALTVHRFRYRFAVDFPLTGEKLDLGEPYFVGSLENLLSVAKSYAPQYDVRASGQVGWQISQTIKFQMGLEYRMENYTSGEPQNILFLLTSAQLSL